MTTRLRKCEIPDNSCDPAPNEDSTKGFVDQAGGGWANGTVAAWIKGNGLSSVDLATTRFSTIVDPRLKAPGTDYSWHGMVSMFTTSLSNGVHGLGNYIDNACVGTGNYVLGRIGGVVNYLVGGVGSFIGGTMTMVLDPYTVVQGIGDAVKNGYNLYNTYGAWAVAAHYTGMQSFAEEITGNDMVTGAQVDALQETSQGFLQLGKLAALAAGGLKWAGYGRGAATAAAAEEATAATIAEDAAALTGTADEAELAAEEAAIGEANAARSGLIHGASETVNSYWDDYYAIVGQEGDDLATTIARLREIGFDVRSGESASLIKGSNIITYGPETKNWELYEEAMHHAVQIGVGSDEIAALTKELRRNFWQRSVRGGSPAAAAEEVYVKSQLLRRLDLDGATRTLLEQQIKLLRTWGMSGGY